MALRFGSGIFNYFRWQCFIGQGGKSCFQFIFYGLGNTPFRVQGFQYKKEKVFRKARGRGSVCGFTGNDQIT